MTNKNTGKNMQFGYITARNLALIAVISTLAGCSTISSLNPFSSNAEAPDTPARLVDFKQTLSVRSMWTVNVGKSEDATLSPALASGSIFAAGGDGTLIRIEGATGRVVWRINAGTRLTAGVGTDGLTIAVAGERGLLMVFDAEGKLRWKAQASSEILSAPAVGKGLVVVRSIDNRIAAYDADSGTRRWIAQRILPPLTLRSAPGIAITGSTAYAGLPGGRLIALATSNGGPRWEVPVGSPKGTTELERISDISGMPVLADGDVCAVAYQGRLACVDVATGVSRWSKEFSSEVGPGIDERNVYAVDDRGNLQAFSRTNGKPEWRNEKLAYRSLSAPVVVGSAVAVGDSQGFVHFVSRANGELVARLAVNSGSMSNSVPLVDGSTAIFQSQRGSVIAVAVDQDMQ